MAFSTADVRMFMMRALSGDEIETFCFDHFPDVQNLFTSAMDKGDRIQLLIEHCVRRERAADLFAALAATLPEQVRAVFGGGPYPAQFEPEAVQARPAAPTVEVHAEMLDKLIVTERSGFHTYMGLALGLVGFGVLVVLVGLLWLGPALGELGNTIRLGSGFGGLFIASLSVLQVREIVTRRDRMSMFAALRSQVSALAARGSVDAATWERIDSLVWRAVAKTTVG